MTKLKAIPTAGTRRAVERLRRATRQAHARLERLPLLAGLAGVELTPARYRRILEALYGFYVRLEPELVKAARRCGEAGRYRRAVRTGWLKRDLEAWGHDAASLELLPRCEKLPEINGEGGFAGCLYVVEGSTLGGRQVARRLEGQGVGGEFPAHRFLRGYGEATGERWRGVCRYLEAALAAGEKREAAEEAARGTFAALEEWLEACGRSECRAAVG